MVDAGLVETVEIFGRNLFACLDVDAAGRFVDHITRRIAAEDLLGRDQQLLEPVLLRLAGGARADLLPGRKHHFARLAIDDVECRLAAAPLLDEERNAPPAATADPGDGIVEMIEDRLCAEPQRIEQRRHRQLALAVDADVDDVLGVEFEIEPGATVRDDPRGEQELARTMGLAAVVIEQHTGRTVHLADDDALGAVDDERAVLRHQRHVAHVDVLLLDIEDGAGFGFGIDFEDDQPQRHFHRRRVGDAALAAFDGVVLGILELVVDEIELAGTGEIADREHRAQRLFQARDIAGRRVRAQKLLVALALDLDQVRHFHHFVDVAENLADALFRRSAGRYGGRGRFCHGRSTASSL